VRAHSSYFAADGGTPVPKRLIIADSHASHPPTKDRLLILDEINVKSAGTGPGDDPVKGLGHRLTGGIELLPGNRQGGAGTPAGYRSINES
jgi:hypothetical protein